MTKNDKIARQIADNVCYNNDSYTEYNNYWKSALFALEYKDKEIAKIKQALKSVLDEFFNFNIE